MLKRILWSCIAIALISWIVHKSIENNRIREEKLLEKEKLAETIRADVNALARAYSASSNWVTTLSEGKQYRLKPVLSVELERAWINNSPILFWGSIKDIATLDENHYEVMFERNLWTSMEIMFDTELRLSLKAKKSQIDSFMKIHPDLFEDHGFNNGVAVVARIDEIYSNRMVDPEYGLTEIKTGDGELLDLIYTGDIEP